MVRADELNNKAVSLVEIGKKEGAKKLFEQALKIDPHHLLANHNYGLLRWREGEITDLEFFKPLEDAVFGQPSKGNYILGLMHMERGELELALDCFNKAVKLAPEESDYQNALGLAYFGLGNYAESSKSFVKAVEREPKNWRYHVNLAASLLREGRKEEAKRHLSEALSTPQGLSGISSWFSISPTKNIESIIPILYKVKIPWSRLLKTFKGHTRGVVSVCFSPDGKLVLSGSIDHTLKIWDGKTAQHIKTFEGHTETVNSVCFSPDGRFALSGSMDKTLRLWDLETGECLKTFEGHTDAVQSVSFSPDGRLILSGGWGQLNGELNNIIRLWDVETGDCIKTFKGHTAGVESVCFSPDGRFALSGSGDNTLRLWDIETSKCVRTFEGHTVDVESVCFSPDGRFALSGSGDNTLRLWDVETGVCIKTFKHKEYVWSVCFSPDGRFAISGSQDTTLRLWDVSTITVEGRMKLNLPLDYKLGKIPTPTESIEITSRVDNLLKEIGTLVQSQKYSQAYKVIKEIRKYPGYERLPKIIELTHNLGNKHGKRTGLKDMWSLKTFEGHTNSVQSVCFSPDGKFALSGSSDYTVRLWDVKTGQRIRTFEGHTSFVDSVCFSPDGRFALSGGWDETLRLWNADTGECIKIFEGHTNIVYSVCFSPDGRFALSGSGIDSLTPNFHYDDAIRLWDVKTGQCVRTFEGHKWGVNSVCFSPDGKFALSGGWDNSIKLWDIETGQCLKTLEGHQNTVRSVCFSPDGRFALSGSDDNSLKIWDAKTGECLKTLEGHTATVYSVCFSPDGRFALSGSSDNTISLWDVETGKCIKSSELHTSGVGSVCFSPDGSFALSGGWDTIIRLWMLDWEWIFQE